MHLLSSLKSGFSEAASGFARVYNRGTTALATLYSDFEGLTQAVKTVGGDAWPLDSRGRATLYAQQYVDVVVYDAAGAIAVPKFTEGSSAALTEVRHPHWTGTAYDTGLSALNNPLSMIALLDGLYTSLGGEDGKVDVAGTDTNIKNAIWSLGNTFINIKDPTYGAVGDGTTDDTAAIQAAIDAAVAKTYDVWVIAPPGDYRITSALSFASAPNVSLMGFGAMTSFTMDHATANFFNIANSGPTNGRSYFIGFRCKAAQANTGAVFVDASGNTTRYTWRDVIMGDGSNVRGTLVSLVNANDLAFDDCEWRTQADAQKMLVASAAAGAGPVRIRRGKAVPPAAAGTVTLFDAKNMDIDGLDVDVSGVTSGTITVFDVSTGGFKSRGLRISTIPAGITVNLFDVSTLAAPAASAGNYQNEFEENDTNVGFITGTFNFFSSFVADTTLLFVRLGSREGRTKWLANTGGNAAFRFHMYSICCINQTAGAAANFTMTGGGQEMAFGNLVLIYHNATGGALTPTFDGNYLKSDGAAASVSAGNYSAFIFAPHPTSDIWVEVGRAENYA